MKKGSKHTPETREKLRIANLGQKAWNKGLKYGKYTEPSNKRFRRDKKYYLNELRENAKRHREKKYNYTNERRIEIKEKTQQRQSRTNAWQGSREWAESEIKYIQENYKLKSIEQIAIKLDRSWSSVSHKLCRLGLKKNRKWI